MGERSQIYVKVDGNLEIANYYAWNYGNFMISRARYGIEWIKDSLDDDFLYLYMFKRGNYNFEEFRRIWDVNFDKKSIAISMDIFDLYKKANTKIAFPDFAYYIDNDDGKLFIFIDTKSKIIKYCFTDYDCTNIMNAKQYLNWNCGEWDKTMNENDKKCCINNIKYIDNIATLMTEDELKRFIKK